jgi:formate dehydrogenase
MGNPPAFRSAPLVFYGLLDAIGTRNRFSAASIDTNAWHVVNQAMFGDPWLQLFVDVIAVTACCWSATTQRSRR